ncbi:MAG TPA: hypothetical protein VFE07_00595 [Marmoricola sp.]|nr:hypothetical protein [Marmoricola sp.]
MTLVVVIVLVTAVVVLWKLRAPLLAKLLGQPRSRIDRQLNSRRRRR